MVVYGYARLVGYDARAEAGPGHPGARRRRGGPHLHPPSAQGPPLVGRRSRSPPRTSATTGRTWRQQGPVADRPRRALLVDGEPPKVEVLGRDDGPLHLDEAEPVLPAGARRRRPALHLPAGPLPRSSSTRSYADPGKLDARWSSRPGRATGRSCISRKDRLYDFDNPDLPTLEPWMHDDAAAGRALHRRCATPTSTASTRTGSSCPTSTGSSCRDHRPQADPDQGRRRRDRPAGARPVLQGLHLPQEGEKRNGLRAAALARRRAARRSRSTRTSTPSDPVWRKLIRDVRFRRALSLGIDRDAINEVLYFGLGQRRPTTRSCRRARCSRRTTGDALGDVRPGAANRLLDEIGLDRRDGDGIRLLPDGRPMEIIVETAGEEHRAEPTCSS